jgi:hypothetical protein
MIINWNEIIIAGVLLYLILKQAKTDDKITYLEAKVKEHENEIIYLRKTSHELEDKIDG